jgi:hypothetical protein
MQTIKRNTAEQLIDVCVALMREYRITRDQLAPRAITVTNAAGAALLSGQASKVIRRAKRELAGR